MLEDFKGHSGNDAIFETDICIIGAGAAGITLARALMKTGREILLLESGGGDFEAATQKLADGEDAGLEYYKLEGSRLRFFGGTTAIWGGRCAQLDDIDFQKRDWVAHSGWPISKDTLRPYYRKAQEMLGLSPIENNAFHGYRNPFQGNIETAFWQFDEMFDRFTLARCDDLVQARNVRILLHANVMNILCDESGGHVQSLEIANLQGGRGRVSARQYIIAAGGIESVRLLLASRQQAHPNGIGNNHDQLGRYFMEHPHARGARIDCKNPAKLFKLLPRFLRHQGGRYGLLMRPSDALQAREGILNTGFTLAVRKHAGEKQVLYKSLYNSMRHELSPTVAGRGLWKLTRRASVYVQDHFGAKLMAAKLKKPGYGIYAAMRAEQAPNPDSRLVLSDDRDVLGLPKISLNWKLSDIDKRSVAVSMHALDAELRRLDLGGIKPAEWLSGDEIWEFDPLISNHPIGGYHHMGGARMSVNPADGVTNEDGRVHGVDNLYVASSAVFPTGGWANPTLTIIALSLRLADFIQKT